VSRGATRQEQTNGEPEPWREGVLRGMLTVAAIIAPPLSALAVFMRHTPSSWLERIVLASSGVLIPLARIVPGLSVRQRTFATILVAYWTGIYMLARVGFAAGITVSMVVISMVGVVALGRRFGFVLIGLTAAAHVVVGVFVTKGVIYLDPRAVDPLIMHNWVRMATTTTLLGVLLTLMIDSVIRHVEASSRATTKALAKLRVAYERLGLLHGRLEAAKEDERRFLAHELHDELGQSLTALKLRLQLGARGAAGPAAAAGEAIALVDNLIARVRKMSVDLRPPLLDEVGLVPALRAYMEAQSSLSGVAMELEEGTEKTPLHLENRLPPDLEIACFRVIQESITNALRHASARRVSVLIVQRPTAIMLSVRDDGRGFDVAATLDNAAAQGHLGVVGMRERVRARGGTFHVASDPGSGTTVTVDLPFQTDQDLAASGAAAAVQ
jgi:signal transduction histidine kinase